MDKKNFIGIIALAIIVLSVVLADELIQPEGTGDTALNETNQTINWSKYARPVRHTEKPIEYCEDELVTVQYTEQVTQEEEVCDIDGKNCAKEDVTRTVVKSKDVIRCMKKMRINNSVLEYEKLGLECTAGDSRVVCDEQRGGDGNGDGICQSGETCTEYIPDIEIGRMVKVR